MHAPSAHKKPKLVSPVPLQQHDEFYKKLYEVNPKSSILSLVLDYSDSFVLQKPSGSQTLPPLPPLLSDVYRPEYLELRYDKLLQVCEEFYNSMEISPEQINNWLYRTCTSLGLCIKHRPDQTRPDQIDGYKIQTRPN